MLAWLRISSDSAHHASGSLRLAERSAIRAHLGLRVSNESAHQVQGALPENHPDVVGPAVAVDGRHLPTRRRAQEPADMVGGIAAGSPVEEHQVAPLGL